MLYMHSTGMYNTGEGKDTPGSDMVHNNGRSPGTTLPAA